MSYDLTIKMNVALKSLDESVKMINQAGRKKAQSEAAYREELAKEILIQRTNGVPVTIINDICRGNAKIAKLKLERDIAESTYQAILESITAQKLTIRVLENQIAREWATNRGGI